ncbi:MAG TPA: cytochrome c biogenesis protein ResB, partial [Actinopolymorphaceae bacterium]
MSETTNAAAPPIGAVGLARWFWRQLTSMRTALLLLFLLALGSVPGSLIPQRGLNPVEVTEFVERNPGLAEWYERLGLFDVFGSVWFGAIYLLLMISLLGCILPRTVQHVRTMRARPPAAPRRLERMPEHRTWTTHRSPREMIDAARAVLRDRRYRVVDDGDSVAAERGYLREVGNLVFHIALVLVLVGVAVGNLMGFKGTALIVEGNGFANTITQYDGYESGRWFSPSRLPPFALTVEKFDVRFETEGEHRGAAREFDALIEYSPSPDEPPRDYHLRINHPLTIGGAELHLVGHGYAPRFTVRDGTGTVVFAGAVPFLPQDGNFSSSGVVKVPDAEPDQLGFQGFFLPTAVIDPKLGPISAFPDALNQRVFLTVYKGDLGLDDGTPQSVYKLELDGLEQLRGSDGEPFRVQLAPGEGTTLPGGGSITFDGFDRWVNLQVSSNPGTPLALTGAVLALGGLLLSLVV